MFSLIWLLIFTANKLGYVFYRPVQFFLLDLLAAPILANLGLWLMRLIHQNNKYKLSGWNILFIIISLSLVFEWWMPKHHHRYTADIWDVLMYGFGGLFFWWRMNKNSHRSGFW